MIVRELTPGAGQVPGICFVCFWEECPWCGEEDCQATCVPAMAAIGTA